MRERTQRRGTETAEPTKPLKLAKSLRMEPYTCAPHTDGCGYGCGWQVQQEVPGKNERKGRGGDGVALALSVGNENTTIMTSRELSAGESCAVR